MNRLKTINDNVRVTSGKLQKLFSLFIHLSQNIPSDELTELVIFGFISVIYIIEHSHVLNNFE